MTDEIQPTVTQEILTAAPQALAAPPSRAAPDPQRYRPWTRPLTYVVFSLGMAAATMLLFSLFPSAIVTGWFALGFGIPAVVLAYKESGRVPAAADHGFIKWGRRAGWLGIALGPASAILWIVLVVALGLSLG
jgi:hypothetical protein